MRKPWFIWQSDVKAERRAALRVTQAMGDLHQQDKELAIREHQRAIKELQEVIDSITATRKRMRHD